MIVLITRDLFFGSKLSGTAQALGLSVTTCAAPDRLRELLQDAAVTGIILDLSSDIPPADVTAAIPDGRPIPRLAFGPHVETARLESARAAGFDQVLPRSRFSAELVQLLRGLATSLR